MTTHVTTLSDDDDDDDPTPVEGRRLGAVETGGTKIGWLGKVGRFNPTVRRRFFRLSSDASHLLYYRNGSATKAKGRIDLYDVTAVRRALQRR